MRLGDQRLEMPERELRTAECGQVAEGRKQGAGETSQNRQAQHRAATPVPMPRCRASLTGMSVDGAGTRR